VKTKLTDVLETKLVPDWTVEGQQLNDTVLSNPKAVLNEKGTTANFRFSSEFVVKFLHDDFEESIFTGGVHNVVKSLESKENSGFVVNFGVRGNNFSWLNS